MAHRRRVSVLAGAQRNIELVHFRATRCIREVAALWIMISNVRDGLLFLSPCDGFLVMAVSNSNIHKIQISMNS